LTGTYYSQEVVREFQVITTGGIADPAGLKRRRKYHHEIGNE
jgi:hypothetical protein